MQPSGNTSRSPANELGARSSVVSSDLDGVTWIASYPRSGSTFLRALLSNYFYGDGEAVSLNDLHRYIPADTFEGLWRLVPGAPSDPALDAVWPARRHFFQHFRNRFRAPPLSAIKTHSANVSYNDIPAFDFHLNDHIVYVARNPLDVAVSYADYNHRDLNSAISMLSLSGALITGGHVGGIELRCSWNEHAISWLTAPPCPLQIIYYRDLCEQTETTLAKLIDFLGFPVDPVRVEHAVRACRFEELRRQEDAMGFIESPDVMKSGRFFREGRSDQWQSALTPDQAIRLADACKEGMSMLGFTDRREGSATTSFPTR
jgi:hypothetical protein